jgi:hypothetical protein
MHAKKALRIWTVCCRWRDGWWGCPFPPLPHPRSCPTGIRRFRPGQTDRRTRTSLRLFLGRPTSQSTPTLCHPTPPRPVTSMQKCKTALHVLPTCYRRPPVCNKARPVARHDPGRTLATPWLWIHLIPKARPSSGLCGVLGFWGSGKGSSRKWKGARLRLYPLPMLVLQAARTATRGNLSRAREARGMGYRLGVIWMCWDVLLVLDRFHYILRYVPPSACLHLLPLFPLLPSPGFTSVSLRVQDALAAFPSFLLSAARLLLSFIVQLAWLLTFI